MLAHNYLLHMRKKPAGIKPSAPYTSNEVHLHISMLRLASFKVPPRHCDDIGNNVVAMRLSKMKVHVWHHKQLFFHNY